ncbi:MAG TPA: ATP synthase F1 subunit delta [Longimicrobium sp.]|nr:ATP synthase F1 subunit delta [Longimicrobium sp.]
MRSQIIARNYAETLLELARRNGGQRTVEEFGAAMDLLAAVVDDPQVREFLATPRIGLEQRKATLRAALGKQVPDLFLRFVMVVVDKRRQALLGDVAHEYRALVDEMSGRVRVAVSISHEPDAKLQQQITATLTERLGREVIPTFTVDPDLLGGMVARVGDEILDGSVRSYAVGLRRRMMDARVTSAPTPAAV